MIFLFYFVKYSIMPNSILSVKFRLNNHFILLSYLLKNFNFVEIIEAQNIKEL